MKLKFFPLQGPDDGAGTGAGGASAGTGTGAAPGAAATTESDAAAGTAAGAGKGAGGSAAGAGTGAGSGSDPAAATRGAGTGAGATAATGAASVAAPIWDADHWRNTWAGTDDKKKGWAERRTDLKVALDSAYAADQKITELTALAKTVLPKDATAEQITQYRKDNAIPEKPEAYFEALPKDVADTLTDDDKGILTPFLGLMHKLNMSPDAAKEFIALRQNEMNRQVEERTQADGTLRVKTEDALRADWGNNYRAEINNIDGLLKGAPEEVRESILQARTPDGNPLVGTPEVVRWLAQLARTVNPYSVPVGADGGSLDQKGVDARIAELDSWMGAKNGTPEHARYWKDEKVQAEYRQLVDARDTLKKRTAA